MITATRTPTLQSAISTLAPIDLTALNSEAELQSRVDRKYVLTRNEAGQFVHVLTREVAPQCLEIAGRREFNYRSDYADTGDLDAYWASVRRSRFRFKVRTRHYLDSDSHWLEVKVRTPRGRTDKHRLPLEARRDPLTAPFITEVLSRYDIPQANAIAGTLRSVVASEYQRTTLFLPEFNSRLTIDSELRWTLPDSSPGQFPLERRFAAVIIETKAEAHRSPVDGILASLGHRPVRISKYATGMAVTHPELPANPWHRLLTRNGVTL